MKKQIMILAAITALGLSASAQESGGRPVVCEGCSDIISQPPWGSLSDQPVTPNGYYQQIESWYSGGVAPNLANTKNNWYTGRCGYEKNYVQVQNSILVIFNDTQNTDDHGPGFQPVGERIKFFTQTNPSALPNYYDSMNAENIELVENYMREVKSRIFEATNKDEAMFSQAPSLWGDLKMYLRTDYRQYYTLKETHSSAPEYHSYCYYFALVRYQ